MLPTQTVLELKHKVSQSLGIEVPQQKILLTGKTLAGESTFYSNSIQIGKSMMEETLLS